jgi:hypothetical protein
MVALLFTLALTQGYATWYDDGPGLYGAAGPALRESLGANWRGQTVDVCSDGRCVTVKLSDWCACGARHGKPTVIDLSPQAFKQLRPLSAGVITVQIKGAGAAPAVTIPPSDILPHRETQRRCGMMIIS